MLKACIFTKNKKKLSQSTFLDHNLLIFDNNFSEQQETDTFDSCFNGRIVVVFVRIVVSVFKLTLLTIFVKSSIMDGCLYAFNVCN